MGKILIAIWLAFAIGTFCGWMTGWDKATKLCQDNKAGQK
jgi:hypothetical protein